MSLESLQNGISNNPIAATTAAAGAGVLVGAVGGALVASSISRKKRHRSKTVRKRSHSRRKMRRTPYTAGKRKDRSHKRIRYTKKGQPYIIKGNGKALFIKKSSARLSRKRKGGRY